MMARTVEPGPIYRLSRVSLLGNYAIDNLGGNTASHEPTGCRKDKKNSGRPTDNRRSVVCQPEVGQKPACGKSIWFRIDRRQCGVVRGAPRLLEMSVVMQHKSSSHSSNHRFLIALHSLDGNNQTGLRVSPPEKRAAEPNFGVQRDTLSESGSSAKHAKVRVFPPIFSGKPRRFFALGTCWRRDRDSNPGYPFEYTRFPSVCLQPLGHLSAGNGGIGQSRRVTSL